MFITTTPKVNIAYSMSHFAFRSEAIASSRVQFVHSIKVHIWPWVPDILYYITVPWFILVVDFSKMGLLIGVSGPFISFSFLMIVHVF